MVLTGQTTNVEVKILCQCGALSQSSTAASVLDSMRMNEKAAKYGV
jgi:hypothetical protein